eukprot:scaffold80914_cov30-Tisochrysis_lutea.AAC.4
MWDCARRRSDRRSTTHAISTKIAGASARVKGACTSNSAMCSTAALSFTAALSSAAARALRIRPVLTVGGGESRSPGSSAS